MLKFGTIWLRFILLCASIPFCWFLCAVFFYILPLRCWAYVVRVWARFMLWGNQIKLEIQGAFRPPYLPPNAMVIANHMCWLDIVVLYCICFINFVGKTEMRKWPILSTMIRAGGTIFIDRSKKRDLIKMNVILSQELAGGRCVGLFPEGAINNGHDILPFKTSLFEAAILAKTMIIPVVLLYYRKDGAFAYEINYRNCNLFQNIIRIIRLDGIKTKVVILDPINAGDFSSRDQLAVHLYNLVNTVYQKR